MTRTEALRIAEAAITAQMGTLDATTAIIEDPNVVGVLADTRKRLARAVNVIGDILDDEVKSQRLARHTVGGKPIGPEGVPYGTTHDMDCPGCADTPFSASPRSEAYWAS